MAVPKCSSPEVVRPVAQAADGRVVPPGDFAVLLKAGMTVKQAIVYNLLSAMMAYIGMLIGTAVGQYANNITLWIFAVTAGMFLYVALVDMVRLPGASGQEPGASLSAALQSGGQVYSSLRFYCHIFSAGKFSLSFYYEQLVIQSSCDE